MKQYFIVVLVLFYCGAAAADDLHVLPKEIDGVPRGELLTRWLLDAADRALAERKARYEQIKTADDIAAYQTKTRQFFLRQLGEFPERTPLKPQVTGRVLRDGFSVEKIIFESRPRHYVTGALFLPDEKKFPPPYPGVLVVCGHSANGKAYDGYQRATALLALNGIAGFIIDPVGQGERSQLLNEDGGPAIRGSTTEHSMLGLGAALVGRNTAHYMVWDGMRAIDYLQSREEVDAERIGCLGNSGGGTQTSYLMALDLRIVCASPSCYITSFEKLLHTIGPQDAEQNIAGQIAFGMNHADYLMVRSPRPTLICAATRDFFAIEGTWDSYRQAKRLYSRSGFAERIDLVENDDKHGYNKPLREAAVQWMVRWLREEDRDIREPEIDVLTEKEIQCTPRGQVMLIDGAVSAFDLNIQENRRLSASRKELWGNTPKDEVLAKVRSIAGVRALDVVSGTAKPQAERASGLDVEKFILQREHALDLPVVQFHATANDETLPAILYISESGWRKASAEGGSIQKLVAGGRTVVAVDVSGIGELASDKGVWYNQRFGSEGKNATVAYLLGRSLTGIRCEDILATAQWLHKQREGERVELIARGNLGPAALHAAALEPAMFSKVKLERSLTSFTSLVETPVTDDRWQHVVHGALRAYDLPDLASTLGDRVEWIEPVDASGKVLIQETTEETE